MSEREPFGWDEVALDDAAIERRAAEMAHARAEELLRRAPLHDAFPTTQRAVVPPPPAPPAPPRIPIDVARPPRKAIPDWAYVVMVPTLILGGISAVVLIPSKEPEYRWTEGRPEFTLPPPLEGGPTADPTRRTFLILQETVAEGATGRFYPAVIHARPGDVLRFAADGTTAHNVSFPADLNTPGVPLPDSGPYLTAPGETWEMTVDLPPGIYHFRCDPHDGLGEHGTLIVDP